MTSHLWSGLFAFFIFSLGIHASKADNNNYPDGPVKVLVGFPPGSGPDLVARILAAKLSESLGKPFVVENRVGATGGLVLESVARSQPNGNTLLLATSAQMTINPALFGNGNVDPDKELLPITLATSNALLLLAAPNFPASSVQDFIKLAKAEPGKYSYASAGVGTEHHLAGEMFCRLAGINLLHVPYKGFPPTVTDLMGGRVDVAFGGIPSALSFVRSGQLKALAVTSAGRYADLPNVPTFIESGIPGYEAYAWYGLLAPQNTPHAIIEKLSATVVKGLHSPESMERFNAIGMEVIARGPQDFASRITSDVRKWTEIIRVADIKPQ
jgi:tripartite-type tricarboxylate transporter receptor subunit TctC